MPRKFSDDDRAYDIGYNDAQHDLFGVIVVIGIVCAFVGGIIGLCI